MSSRDDPRAKPRPKPPVDRRGRLEEEIFTYQATKDGKVMVHWRGQCVTILKGTQAEKFLARIEGLDPHQTQLALAKLTGHFKHGNE